MIEHVDDLYQVIAMPIATRKMVAVAYRDAMISGEPIDWPIVNGAIIERWSRSGLQYVKARAWSLLSDDERTYMEGR